MTDAQHTGEADLHHEKYHHGRSPAAWAGVAIAFVGFVLAGYAVLVGPNWTLLIVSGAIMVVSLIVARILQVAGFGNA